MSSVRWKAVESYYCTRLGGQRRGADYGDARGGKNDCKDCGWSVEIRHRERISFADIVDQVAKAEARAEAGQIPISISHTPGTPLDDGIVSMSWKSFQEWFVK